MRRRSTPASSRCVANVCRNVSPHCSSCIDSPYLFPASSLLWPDRRHRPVVTTADLGEFWLSNSRMALSWLCPHGCSLRSYAAACTRRLRHAWPSRPSWPCVLCVIASPCSTRCSPLRLVYHNQKEHVMHKSLPPLPASQAPVPCPIHTVWPQLPTDRRQQCHALMAQRLLHVSHRTLSEACNHAHQDSPEPFPT